MSSSRELFATSFRLSDFIDTRKNIYTSLKEKRRTSETISVQPKEEQETNLILCWAD
jgi:hypothetical protein